MLLEIHASVVVGFMLWHVKISKNLVRLVFMDPQNIPHQILYYVEIFSTFLSYYTKSIQCGTPNTDKGS